MFKKSDIIQMYFRLLSYAEAVEVKNYFNNKYEYKKETQNLAYSNITTGGLSVRGTKEQLEDVVDFVSNKGFGYEVTFEHPTKVTKRIIESFKSKN